MLFVSNMANLQAILLPDIAAVVVCFTLALSWASNEVSLSQTTVGGTTVEAERLAVCRE